MHNHWRHLVQNQAKPAVQSAGSLCPECHMTGVQRHSLICFRLPTQNAKKKDPKFDLVLPSPSGRLYINEK